MPANKGAKRKATTTTTVLRAAPAKKQKATSTPSDPLRQPHPFHDDSEKYGIVLREFYPHEMSNDRARAYNRDELPRPIEELQMALRETSKLRSGVQTGAAVVHWFKMDLRTADNNALALASAKAKDAGVPLITMYLISPQDFAAHLRSPARVDLVLRTLEVLRQDLAKLDIPLYIETVERRKRVPDRILELMGEWGASHLFTNMEYEVDELRREARLVRMLSEKRMVMEVVHDTCVVPPGALSSGSGKQYAVYTPWFRSWIRHVHENLDLLELFDQPASNPQSARDNFEHLFNCQVPAAPEKKKLDGDEAERFQNLWPAGEHDAMKRLETFCENRIGSYHNNRNIPADDGTSSLSAYLACGTISARTCVRVARDHNRSKSLDGGHQGIQTWISEVAWRDFYRHVLVNWPYVW
jgi:deoxyribodipyrimidine photo-lyase